MAASEPAYRTISEVADQIGVPQHVLRFWETRFPQIQPMKRGGNRRYYRPQDIDLLTRINRLLHSDGYTIKGVQKLLEGAGEPPVAAPAARPAASSAALAADTSPLRAIRNRLAAALDEARAL